MKASGRISVIFFAVLAVFVLEAPDASAGMRTEIVVGSEPDYPPYAMVTAHGKADGFSVELMQAVCKVMGIKCTFRVAPWNDILSALERGEIDALPLVSYSEDRDRVLDFTTPHTIGNGVLFKRKESPDIDAMEDLHDKAIVVMKSDATHDWLVHNNISPNLKLSKTVPEALRMVASGKYDYAFAPRLVGLLIANELQLTNLEVTGPLVNVHGRGYGFAVKNGDFELITQLNEGLQIIKATGLYDEIYDKWFSIIDPKGVPKSVVVYYITLVGGTAAILGILMAIWGAALRRAVERKLQVSEQHYRTLVESTPNGINEIDAYGNILYCNLAFAKLTGYSPDELTKMSVSDLATKDERKRLTDDLARFFTDQPGPFLYFNKIVTKDGDVLDLEINWDYKRNGAGDVISIISIITDITERKRMERALAISHDELEQQVKQRTTELTHAKEHAEKANLAKTKFLAAASHDLRQPLQALNLFLSTLAGRVHDSTSRHLIKRIENSVDALEELLNALLDISKFEAGLITPDKQPFAISSILNRLSDEFKETAGQKGLEFCMVTCKANIESDPALLENILRNLISNAIRHTEQGKILLGCRHRNGHLRIEVWDTGIGISEKHQDLIFQEFYQVGNASRDRNQGLGLGLSIVCKTAELLGHTIEVHSVPGKGSVFSVEVLISNGMTKDRSHVVPKPLSMFKKQPFIVVVDDDIDVLESIRFLLDCDGCRVVAMLNMDQCNQFSHPASAPPDMIIADYNLQNGMTGIDAVTLFHEQFKTKIPAILLTGDTKPSSLSKIEKCGLQVLHKPIKGERLRKIVHEMLGSNLAG